MWTDVVDLRSFYASGLGRVARRMIGERIRDLWPDVRGMNLLGVGYATPFLEPFRDEAARVLALMPAGQGVAPWPSEGAGSTALADETDLPFADRSMNRLLVVHALECAEPPRTLMRELWRVLADDGHMLVVVPNRRGLWAQLERTPFGHGRPYSPGQLSHELRQSMFMPAQSDAALFVPPTHSQMVLSAAAACERIGHSWCPRFAGVVLFEATKQIYAGHFAGAAARAASYAPIVPR